jgi:hypothetical protein
MASASAARSAPSEGRSRLRPAGRRTATAAGALLTWPGARAARGRAAQLPWPAPPALRQPCCSPIAEPRPALLVRACDVGRAVLVAVQLVLIRVIVVRVLGLARLGAGTRARGPAPGARPRGPAVLKLVVAVVRLTTWTMAFATPHGVRAVRCRGVAGQPSKTTTRAAVCFASLRLSAISHRRTARSACRHRLMRVYGGTACRVSTTQPYDTMAPGPTLAPARTTAPSHTSANRSDTPSCGVRDVLSYNKE